MRLLPAALVVVLLAGCASDSEGPSLKAFSDPDGVLHISGSGWKGCSRVSVNLPAPWTGSKPTVTDNGSFSLSYAHPVVKAYEGVVAATCAEGPTCSANPPRQEARAEIRVGDARSHTRQLS